MKNPSISLSSDAFSQGQVFSKLWLLEELEILAKELKNPKIWVLGGWYGLLAFMIFTRNNIKPGLITSIDIDAEANTAAEIINHSWTFNPERFSTRRMDCTKLDFTDSPPQIVINTACEHFSPNWADNLPPGVLVAIQSTNMEHKDHHFKVNSAEELLSHYSVFKNVMYKGQKDFNYPNLQFSRFMVIASP
jgi:hypothetical protein